MYASLSAMETSLVVEKYHNRVDACSPIDCSVMCEERGVDRSSSQVKCCQFESDGALVTID